MSTTMERRPAPEAVVRVSDHQAAITASDTISMNTLQLESLLAVMSSALLHDDASRSHLDRLFWLAGNLVVGITAASASLDAALSAIRMSSGA